MNFTETITLLATVSNVIIAISNYKIARNNYALTKEKQEKEATAKRRYQCERVNFDIIRDHECDVSISNTSSSAISNVFLVITQDAVGSTFDDLLQFPWEYDNAKWVASIPSGNYKVVFGDLDMRGMAKYPVVSAMFTDINSNEWFINSEGEIFECPGYNQIIIDKDKLSYPIHPNPIEKI